MPNTQIPYIGAYVQIVVAVLNAFHLPRATPRDKNSVLVTRILALAIQPQHLPQYLEGTEWLNGRVIWLPMTSAGLPDFPRLTEVELQTITLDVYPIKQVRSYTEEHTSDGT